LQAFPRHDDVVDAPGPQRTRRGAHAVRRPDRAVKRCRRGACAARIRAKRSRHRLQRTSGNRCGCWVLWRLGRDTQRASAGAARHIGAPMAPHDSVVPWRKRRVRRDVHAAAARLQKEFKVFPCLPPPQRQQRGDSRSGVHHPRRVALQDAERCALKGSPSRVLTGLPVSLLTSSRSVSCSTPRCSSPIRVASPHSRGAPWSSPSPWSRNSTA